MKGGLIDRRITIQVKTEVIASNGQRTLEWSTFKETWANPVEKDGVEKTANNNRSTVRVVNFRIRYRSDITNEMLRKNFRTYSDFGLVLGIGIAFPVHKNITINCGFRTEIGFLKAVKPSAIDNFSLFDLGGV